MNEEQIVGIIPNTTKKRNLIKKDSYNLVVTNQRIIGAKITSEMLKAAAQKASEDSKVKGEGFLKRMLKTATSGFKYHEKYLTMQPNEILEENVDNFSLSLSEIRKVKFRSGDIEMNLPDAMVVVSAQGKVKYELKSSIGKAKKILKQVIPGRV